jgi:YebC/PmpR family DNA-binding regulatory protein
MSGHSHAKTIKHQKDLTDQKRGKMFSKMARMISVAVKQGGADPIINTKLQAAIGRARELNMPKDNIERAIEQALGGKEGANLEEVAFEAYGPGGIAVIIEGITDNKNRTLGEIKQVLNQFGGKLVGEGGVKWMFDKKGCISINIKSQEPNLQNKDDLEMMAIESGAEDIYNQDDILDIYTKIENLENIKKDLEKKGIKPESTSLDWVPKEEVSVEERQKESCQKLFDNLDELDSVQGVYSNLKF